jgi:hypothetical protein
MRHGLLKHRRAARLALVGCVLILSAIVPTPRLGGFAPASPSPTEAQTGVCTVFPPAQQEAPGDVKALVPGQMRLQATFMSIGVEVLFRGDVNLNGRATLDFRPSGSSGWRCALPLWRADDGSPDPGPAFYGSALLLAPGTSYDIRVTFSDPDGVAGPLTLNGRITTRTENISSAHLLTPTHFVAVNGHDSNDGASPLTPWRTIEQAIRTAPSGAVVLVGPGHYPPPGSTRSTPLTLLGQHRAVDDARQVVNQGRHAIVEPPGVSSPVSAKDGPNPGVWRQVTVPGPGFGGAPPGAPYRIWKWANSPVVNATQLGYATTREGLPQRVAHWKSRPGTDIGTAAGWVEKLHTNRSYNHGFYSDGPDLYLRLVGDVDPNTLYITAGTGVAIRVAGPQVRISGLEIRQFDVGVSLTASASHAVIDHNLLSGLYYAVRIDGIRGTPSVYGGDHVIQYNRFVDSNLWSDDQQLRPSIPWTFVKSVVINADGSAFSEGHLGEFSEGFALFGDGGGQRVVARYNAVDGLFNGFSAGRQLGFDRYAGMGTEFHDNFIRRAADDAFELNLQSINVRIWNNRTMHTLTLLASPNLYGPIYLFKNEAWRIGNRGIAEDRSGVVKGVTGVAFKYSGASVPPARIWMINNTIWTDEPIASGGALFATDGPSSEAFYLRNNIISATGYAFWAPTDLGRWNEDYNHFSTTDSERGLRYGSSYTTNVAAYRAASGQGAHTNVSSSFISPPALLNPLGGDLRLPVGSPLINAGVPVPNIMDRANVDYFGAAPDLGATQTGGVPLGAAAGGLGGSGTANDLQASNSRGSRRVD